MAAYSVFLFVLAVLFFGLAAAAYRGKIHLIHERHSPHAKEFDKKKYDKMFSKGLFILAISLVFSGIAAFFGANVPAAILSIVILFAGVVLASLAIANVQKEFHGGF